MYKLRKECNEVTGKLSMASAVVEIMKAMKEKFMDTAKAAGIENFQVSLLTLTLT